ncbi:MAG TPA: FAD-dependent oxidoreductase [Bryobacteraceae bacterium]|nr:FAD-dependent oxidoreductase [Bryobacteraceae bacterium]
MNASGGKLLGNRRQFLSAALVGLAPKTDRRVEGNIVDDSHLLGHRLRDRGQFPAPKEQVKIPLVIVGAGIAGLSAAWRLEKKGFRDFVVLEMERAAGGNSRYGENGISAYPWAAHYLPVPNRKSLLVRELCEEFGLIENGHFNERHLCHSPQERLFLHGRWQEGLEPDTGVTRDQKQQQRRFEEKMAEFAASGQFTIPMAMGAKPSPLDHISMEEWLNRQAFHSPYLRWYVNYACRDDYGALARDTSAWAGIHYFASREHEDRGPFAWPEGNGWMVKQLMRKLGRYVRTSAIVTRVTKDGRVFTEKAVYRAQAVIWAAPTFLLPYVAETAPDAGGLVYSPWVTANLTLDRLPREHNSELAWDNVIYDSPALGYVNATHQSLRSHVDRTVWTYYWALAEGSPAANRKLLLEKDWSYWKDLVLRDLEKAHPDIRQCVARIEVMRFGHAMARPVPGWMFHDSRRRLMKWGGNIVLANSDLSGFSIFEEAQHHGVRAADRVLKRMSRG